MTNSDLDGIINALGILSARLQVIEEKLFESPESCFLADIRFKEIMNEFKKEGIVTISKTNLDDLLNQDDTQSNNLDLDGNENKNKEG